MTQPPLHADTGLLSGVKDEFRALGRELRDAPGTVRTDAKRVRDGAGEFGDALADGLAAFELSWQAGLDATSDTAGRIAANVGGYALDLEALDLGNS